MRLPAPGPEHPGLLTNRFRVGPGLAGRVHPTDVHEQEQLAAGVAGKGAATTLPPVPAGVQGWGASVRGE